MPLFPPSLEYNAKRLDSLESFINEFNRLWSQLNLRFFKYERLQSYEELPGTPSWEAFKSNDKEKAKSLMAITYLNQMPLYREMIKKQLHYDRIRVVEKPLSEYLEFEFLAYPYNAMFGERVMVVDLSANHYIYKQHEATSDFMLFDDYAVLINDYGQDGHLQGGWLIDSKESLLPYIELAERSYKHAVPLGYFLYGK